MELRELILKNRSYRRFHESARISESQLAEWIDLARLSASGRNAQPLKYLTLSSPESCARIFPLLAWAGYLSDWPGPQAGERPSAYIVILHDTAIASQYFCDDGIAAQSILLGATEAGFGGCMIASVKKDKLIEIFELDDRYRVLMVIALGKPAEMVEIEKMEAGNFRYWRDASGVHHVPKRPLDELILSK